MKKNSIWLIIGVMILAFSGLLYMQVNYINVVYQTRDAQFDDAVRQALFDVNHDLELDEMAKLVNKELGYPTSMVQDLLKEPSPHRFDPMKPDFKLDQLPKPLLKPNPSIVRREDRISETFRLLQSQYTDRYNSLRQTIIELAMTALQESGSKPIYERVTAEQLGSYLSKYLSAAGITIPYLYEVVDKDNRKFFSTGAIPQDDAYSVYTQAMFQNDIPSRLHFLRIYFPGKRQYISSSIEFLIPSIIFSVLLFITFAYTIASLFRQKKLDEMRSDFINNMTHELKTPVSTILLGTEMLYDPDMISNDQAREKALTSIAAEGNRLNLLIEKVLQMSFFNEDDHKIKFKIKLIDMEELVINVTSIFSLKVESFGGELDVDLSATGTIIEGDEMHLTNIIFNLLDNSVKYRKPEVPPLITVRTLNENNNLVIKIEDNGIGMKREYLKKIFDRFYRIPTGNRHDVKGFGLGLAYVARMVHLHGGQIHAESELGKGTTFIIHLPLKKDN